MPVSLSDEIDSIIKSIPLASNSSAKYKKLLPKLSELSGVVESEIHVTAAKAPSNAEGRLRNGKHQNRHYELCFLLVSSDRIDGVVGQSKKHIDDNLNGFFNTIVVMTPSGANGRWLVSHVVTNNETGPVVSQLLAKYPQATVHKADNITLSVQSTHTSGIFSSFDWPLQRIIYGAPGTGKSRTIKDKITDESIAKDCVFRTIFHPDSDYASFVGCYKPKVESIPKTVVIGKNIECAKSTDPTVLSKGLLEEKRIVYTFVPQVFLKAYTKAWEEFSSNDPSPVLLVIEEINRGNCAQIFGDQFQLLDRHTESGFSEYPIVPDDDIRCHLAWVLENAAKSISAGRKDEIDAALSDATEAMVDWDDVSLGNALVLPPNLYIWATMNTSDQSLFPMDSAFKRRWEWEYVPIADAKKGWAIVADGKRFDWWAFLEKANAAVRKATGSEDKELGYFFVKPPEGSTEISAKTFVDKVLFYLFGDAFKDDTPPLSLFPKKSDGAGAWTLRDFRENVLDGGSAKSKPNEKNLAVWLEQIEVKPPDGTDSSSGGNATAADEGAAAAVGTPAGETTPAADADGSGSEQA